MQAPNYTMLLTYQRKKNILSFNELRGSTQIGSRINIKTNYLLNLRIYFKMILSNRKSIPVIMMFPEAPYLKNHNAFS